MRLIASALLILMTMSAGAKPPGPMLVAASKVAPVTLETPSLKPKSKPKSKSRAKSKNSNLLKKSKVSLVQKAEATFVASAAAKGGVATPVMLQLDPAVTIAQAYTTEDEKLQAILSFVYFNDARKYGWPSNYTAMWCPTNAFHLLKRLQQAGVDLQDAEVWYLIPPESATGSGDSVIHPRQARPVGDSSVSDWAFHVVISVHGRILDLDFKAQPEVLSQVQYASQMWAKGPLARPEEDARPLYVRRIPAVDYLAQYTNNWDYYISGGVSGGRVRYPAVEVSSLFPRAAVNAAQ